MSAVLRLMPVEHDLVLVTRALFAPGEHGLVAPLLRVKRPLGDAVGPDAMCALEEALAKGVTRFLARTALAADVPLEPRPELRFSSATFEILAWLVRTPLSAPQFPPLAVEAGSMTPADQLVAMLVVDVARAASVESAVLAQPAIGRAPLVALAAIDELARLKADVPDGAPLATPALARLVALLETNLARRWVTIEQQKPSLAAPRSRVALGRSQAAVLDGLVRNAIAERRLDVLSFLLDAMDAVTRSGGAPWGMGLERNAPLGERAEAWRADVAPLRAVLSVAALRDRLRFVGFVDDEYEDARRLLRTMARWEGLFLRAEEAVRAADALESVP